ncbi:MAG: glycosyltransferase family 4 protein [Fimbriimonas sp.]
MKIGIYGRGLQNRAGIGRYTRGLLRAMLANPRGHEILIFGGSTIVEPALREVTIPLPSSGNRIWEEQVALPTQTRRHGLDVFFNPDFTLPIRATGARKEVVTVHDAAFRRYPESNSRNSRLLLGTLLPPTLRRADAILANSEFTKREFMDLFGVDAPKVHAIPLGIEPSFAPSQVEEVWRVRERYALPERFILAVGSIEPRKNFIRLAAAVAAIPRATLVIAGGDAKGAAQIRAEIGVALGNRVKFLGFVPEEDAAPLLTTADLLVYPSLYEGFGFPPLEAMACGTPTLVANAASMPEVVGDAADLFDPLDGEDLREKLTSIWRDEERRNDLRARGLRRAAKFTWEETARRTLEVFEAWSAGT